jgi:nicotinamidase-related amidase
VSDQDEDDKLLAPLAELAAAVCAGRPERVLDITLAQEPPEVRAAFAATAEALATLALAETPVAPSAGLRDRLMQTLATRQAPRRRALVVLDMIKEHLTPGMPLEVPRARDIVPALSARLEAARREGTPVVYLVDEHDPSDADLDAVTGWGAHAIKGSEGTDVWPAIAPQPGDRIVKKATYSAFTDSAFASVLGELKVDTIVLTGCLTEIGMLATATDALQRGFAVEVPADSQAGANPMSEQVALGVLAVMPPYGPARKALLANVGA